MGCPPEPVPHLMRGGDDGEGRRRYKKSRQEQVRKKKTNGIPAFAGMTRKVGMTERKSP